MVGRSVDGRGRAGPKGRPAISPHALAELLELEPFDASCGQSSLDELLFELLDELLRHVCEGRGCMNGHRFSPAQRCLLRTTHGELGKELMQSG